MGYNGLVDIGNWFASWGPPPFEPNLAGIDLNGNGSVEVLGMNVLGGSPLPGGGFNEFGVGKGKNELIQLVSQYNQTYAGKAEPVGKQVFPTITLPAKFSFPHSFNSQNLRLSKIVRLHGERLRLAVFAECFNIFNIANLTGYNSALNAPNFGEATQRTPNIFGTGGPRAFQLGSRLTFRPPRLAKVPVMQIVPAVTAEHFAQVRQLFEEYWQSFGFTPCFQNFAAEVAGLPGYYAPPEGRLALAFAGPDLAGCIALRRLDAARAEAKRLYVRPQFRNQGIGLALLQWAIGEARAAGYREMLGDTMPVMRRALEMYDRLGFERTAPYSPDATPGAVYLRLAL